MRNLVIIFALLFVAQFSNAQQNNIDEIGISRQGVFSGNFGFTYRDQKSALKYRRYEIITSKSGIFDIVNLHDGLTFKTGIEKRKDLKNEKWQYCRGWLFGIGYQGSILEKQNAVLTPNIGYSFGWQYKLNENMVMRAEITPTLSQKISNIGNPKVNDLGLSFDSPITISFCWKRSPKQY